MEYLECQSRINIDRCNPPISTDRRTSTGIHKEVLRSQRHGHGNNVPPRELTIYLCSGKSIKRGERGIKVEEVAGGHVLR